MNYSTMAAELWNVYADEFQRRWGMDREVAAIIGARSKQLFAAEFKERGERAYADSVVIPVRNAFYSAAVIDYRWRMLKDIGLVEPVLDYGCGTGFLLMWLKMHGMKQLYAYDIPGIQYEVQRSVLSREGIPAWNGEPVNTVLCINVLEHVKDPMALLNKLYGICPRVIANICTDDDAPHIAPHEELEKCRDILLQKETLYRAA